MLITFKDDANSMTSSLNVLHVVYVADCESKKWITYDRTTETPPFTYCGIDLFGPFYIKEKRTELKRCGAMFVCLASRTVHIGDLLDRHWLIHPGTLNNDW